MEQFGAEWPDYFFMTVYAGLTLVDLQVQSLVSLQFSNRLTIKYLVCYSLNSRVPLIKESLIKQTLVTTLASPFITNSNIISNSYLTTIGFDVALDALKNSQKVGYFSRNSYTYRYL